jgi:WD40 repeat protein
LLHADAGGGTAAAAARPLCSPSRSPCGHHGIVFSAAISDDGTTVASASEDATVKLWRLPEAMGC